jgi:hypothetical protein
MRRPPSSKIVEGKRHEMFKSRLQSRHWSCRLSARLAQQATLLFKALPRCFRSCAAKPITTESRELLRMAFLAADSSPFVTTINLDGSRSWITAEKCLARQQSRFQLQLFSVPPFQHRPRASIAASPMLARQFITWCPTPLVAAVRLLVVHLAAAVARGLALVHHQIAGDESLRELTA